MLKKKSEKSGVWVQSKHRENESVREIKDRQRRMDDVKGEGIGFRKREIAASSRK